jgi:hypothetical protein
MSTTHNGKKLITSALGAAVAGAAVPTLLFLAAGTAQADTSVSTVSDPLGVTVRIRSSAGPGGEDANVSHGRCTYSATPQAGTGNSLLPPLPAYAPFYLQGRQTFELWLPGIQTETVWDVSVDCEEGRDQTNPVTVVY